MGAGAWWLPATTPDQQQRNVAARKEIERDNLNHNMMRGMQPWWGSETAREKSLRAYMDNLDREHEANRVRWADYSCPQTKPSEWFDIKPTKGVRARRPRQSPPSYDDSRETKASSILNAHDGNGIVVPTYGVDDEKSAPGVDGQRKRSRSNPAMEEYKWLEESRSDECVSIRCCTCLEPFSSCHQEPHYHHQSFHLMPICCGHCDGQKMTCWCIEHNWPAGRMDYATNLCKQEEDKDKPMYERNHRLSRRPCRRNYKRCEDQPCPHTFAEWTQDPRTREWTWKYV